MKLVIGFLTKDQAELPKQTWPLINDMDFVWLDDVEGVL